MAGAFSTNPTAVGIRRVPAPKRPPVSINERPTGANRVSNPSPKPKRPKAPKVRTPKVAPAKTAEEMRNDALVRLMANPLAPMNGRDAVDAANALQQSQIRPVMRDFDRQYAEAEQRGKNQVDAARTGYESLIAKLGEQIQGGAASQAQARERIGQANAAYQQALQNYAGQVNADAAHDASVRGAGLDGGSGARFANELATQQARGAARSQISLDQQATNAASADALMRQIHALAGVRGAEAQKDLQAQTNNQLRDINQGRSSALDKAQGGLVDTLLNMRSQGAQTALATQTLLSDAQQKEMDRRARVAMNDADNATSSSNNQRTNATSAANNQRTNAQSNANSKRTAATAAANRASREQIARLRDQTRNGKASKSDRQKLWDATKTERGRLNSIVLSGKAGEATDPLLRKMVGELRKGGLSVETVRQYRARFGGSPPSSMKRRTQAGSGFLGNAAGGLLDFLK